MDEIAQFYHHDFVYWTWGRLEWKLVIIFFVVVIKAIAYPLCHVKAKNTQQINHHRHRGASTKPEFFTGQRLHTGSRNQLYPGTILGVDSRHILSIFIYLFKRKGRDSNWRTTMEITRLTAVFCDSNAFGRWATIRRPVMIILSSFHTNNSPRNSSHRVAVEFAFSDSK